MMYRECINILYRPQIYCLAFLIRKPRFVNRFSHQFDGRFLVVEIISSTFAGKESVGVVVV